MSGVEEAEHNAQNADEHHFHTTIHYERQSYQAGYACGDSDGMLHLIDTYPSLGTGSPWT